MICLLSYVGMNLQSEVCLWTLLGILKTMLEATSLFKVNDKLKQVWTMQMPPVMSMPVQRVFRTMICGVLLVQCFTVYVYLASFVVLLYPVVLEERPTLVLLWLLIAAVRNFLCELTSLALGLGACVLLGPSKPSCLKFLISRVASITPSFYMWMLVYTYYKSLKLAIAFNTFPAVVATSDHDYGLEMAVRRRMTKSLQKEEQLRRNLTAIFQNESRHLVEVPVENSMPPVSTDLITEMANSKSDINGTTTTIFENRDEIDASERLISNVGIYEDWCGDEVTLPRDADRILEQFVLMMLRIAAFIKSGEKSPRTIFSSLSPTQLPLGSLDCSGVNDADPPPSVGNSRPRRTSYIQEYPQIFMKRASDSFQRLPEQIMRPTFTVQPGTKSENNTTKLLNNTPLLMDSKNMTICECDTSATSEPILKTVKQASSENDCRKIISSCTYVELVSSKKIKEVSVSTDTKEIVLKEAFTDTHLSDELLQMSEAFHQITNTQNSIEIRNSLQAILKRMKDNLVIEPKKRSPDKQSKR